MQGFACLAILLYLTANMDTTSVERTKAERGVDEKKLLQGERVLHAISEGNSNADTVNAELCSCKNGFCEEVEGKSVCKCYPEWGLYQFICERCQCGMDANCTFDWRGVKSCICKEGYEQIGGACKGTCKRNPCKNGGECAVKGNDIECKCKTPFFGELCEKAICKCENGFCEEVEGESVCKCHPEWGLFNSKCHECACGKDANCTFVMFLINKKCLCKEGYKDINGICKGTCQRNPCKNGGECVVEGDDIECKCKTPFFGELCERDISLVSTTPIFKTTLPVSLITSADNSTRTSDVRTRDIFTDISTESSTSKIGNSTISEPEDTTVSRLNYSTPISTSTTESSKNHSLDVTAGSTSTTMLPTTAEIHSTDTDPCAVNPCQNGGICKTEGNGTKCYCIAPFSGERCEKDPCSSTPCMNGGLCKMDGTSFLCECISPYYGTSCEKDPCTENPCQNGGTCFVSENGFECKCKEPYAGVMCETDPCVWNPCKNGGICKIVKGAVKCFCTEPFSGAFCDSVTDSCVWNPCKNGGICKLENKAVKCFCKEPFTGEFCDSRSEIDGNVITLAVVSVLLVIVLIFVSCILRQRSYFTKVG